MDIKGGVSYFLCTNDIHEGCRFYYHENNEVHSSVRIFSTDDHLIIFRDSRAVEILKKIEKCGEESFAKLISKNDPFGFDRREKHSSRRVHVDYKLKPFKNSVSFYYNGWRKFGVGYVDRKEVGKNIAWVDLIKVMIPKAWGVGDGRNDRVHPFIVDAGSVCTETYLVVGPFKDRLTAENVKSYIETKFFHFLVSLLKNTQNTMHGVYRFVPLQEFSESWTDEKLYKKYKLAKEEIAFIESMIKPMA
jgi:site-specific DNA-methyltransferase (adenine-specific)